MRGVIRDCFQISGRGAIAALMSEEGNLRIGDWLVARGGRWRISGIDMPNYHSIPDPAVLKLKGVLLAGATESEIASLIGEPFVTEPST